MEKAQRFDPDQLRRVARRAIETIEPDQAVVDAHENQLVATEEEAARARCSLSLHDNDDGTTTGHFTVPSDRGRVPAQDPRLDDRTPADARASGRASTGTTVAGLRSPTSSSTCPPSSCTPGPPPPSSSPSTTASSPGPSRPPGSTPARPSPPAKPDASPAEPGSCPPSSAAAPSPSTSAASPDSSPKPNGSRSGSHTTPAQPTAARNPSPGASSTTDNPGAAAAAPTSPRLYPLCHWHHQRIHDHTYRHSRAPNGTIRFSRVTGVPQPCLE